MSKQEKSASKTAKLDQAELRKLWKQPTAAWVTLLNTLGAQKVKEAGETIKLQCPYHPDTNPSGVLSPLKGHYRCFSCGTYTSDPIRFVNKYLHSTYIEVARTFRDHFKLEKLDIKKLDEAELEQHRMKMLNEVFHQYLCKVWLADKVPQNAANTVTWLKQRGITSVDMLGSLGMLPTSTDLQKLCAQLGGNEEDITWCMRLVGDYLNVTYMNCVTYTYAVSPDEVSAFKLRIPGPDKASVRFVRPKEGGELGAFGVLTSSFYKHYASEKVTRFIAVEGEHDALALTQGMLTNCPDVDEVVIALGGAGHNGVDFMADLGFTECRLMGDDDAAGDSYPASVLPKTRRVAVQVFKWPQRIRNPVPGKIDPDEAIKVHGFDVVFKEVCEPKNYIFATRWCIERAKTRIKGIHQDNIIGLQEVGTEFSTILRNDAERQVFAEEFARMCPSVPATDLLRKTQLQDDTALGFVEKIADWIRSNYQVTTWDCDQGVLKLWNKTRKQYLPVQVDHKAAITQFKRYTTRGSLYYWARDEIGLPSYFPSVDDPESAQTALDKSEEMIEKDVQRAYSMLSAEAVDYAGGFIKGQGIHLENVDVGKPGYIVNGNRVYRLKWTADLSSLSTVTELEGPSDNGIVFDLDHRRNLIEDMEHGWTNQIKCAADITQRPPYTAHQTFTMVHKLINTGFGFRNQEVDSLYCAGLVFYNHLYDVITGRRMLTHYQAQFESGKTTLLSVTANHTQLREFSLCDHALALDSFTQAGFYQIFTNTRLVSALDEMNDPDDGSPDSRNKKTFYQRCRTLATAGKATLSQGTVEGQSRAYHLQNNVITASGTPIVDAMDESRFNTINLKKNPNHNNVRLELRNAFSLEEIEKLRLSVLLHSLHLAPRVKQRYSDLYNQFGRRQAGDGAINIQNVDRFTENLMPMAAVLDAFGVDGKKFIEDYRETRKQQVYERNRSTAGHNIIDTVLNAPIPAKDEPNQFTNIKSMLLDQNQRDKISASKVGVYYDERSQCIGIMWSEVKQTLLKNAQYRTKTPFSLKSEAETAGEWLIDKAEATKLGIITRLMAAGMTSSSDVYSLISVGNLIDKHRKAIADSEAFDRNGKVSEVAEVIPIKQPFTIDEGDPLQGID